MTVNDCLTKPTPTVINFLISKITVDGFNQMCRSIEFCYDEPILFLGMRIEKEARHKAMEYADDYDHSEDFPF